MDWGIIKTDESTAMVHRCEKGAEPEDKAFNSLVHLCSNTHIRAQNLGSE